MSWSRRAPRKRSPIPVYRGSADEAQAERMAQRARELAPVLGYCGSCGVIVDEAAGKLHTWDCPDVPPARRQVRA